MAVIVMEFANIQGESTVTGFKDQVDALSIRDSIVVSVPQGSGRTRTARTVGKAQHSDIGLVRYKDRASPKLAEACSSGRNLGEVKINLFRTIENGTVQYMQYTLSQTFVSRYENDTLDEDGIVFEPTMVPSAATAASSWGAVGLMASVLGNNAVNMRPAPRSLRGGSRREPQNQEAERIWLNAATVKWTYTPYAQGSKGGTVEKGWNVQQGAEL